MRTSTDISKQQLRSLTNAPQPGGGWTGLGSHDRAEAFWELERKRISPD